MTISAKNAEKGLRMTGLDRPGPIRADVKDEMIVRASRLAEFLDRQDHLDNLDLGELPPLRPFNPLRPKI